METATVILILLLSYHVARYTATVVLGGHFILQETQKIRGMMTEIVSFYTRRRVYIVKS